MIKFLKRVAMLSGIAALSVFQSFAQDSGEVSFRYPLDVPMSLSGNYGELRSNHFHGGIDFRVGGVVGAPIYASAQGYISRITVSPSGYGNALYITHPNGYVTVYGHMHCFADEIADFVRARQYSQESFRQDISLSPEQFPVKKGDYIGKAGNTGSSGGPHLHFEIRDEDNTTTNAFGRGYFSIKDNTSPVFNSVMFYGLENVYGVPESYYIGMPRNGVFALPEHSYICIDAVDRQEGTNAKLAVNEYKVFLDGELLYHFTLGEVPYSKDRDINSLIEYKQKAVRGKSFVKSYVEPGNMLRDRIVHENNGVISLRDTLLHKIKVVVKDVHNNSSTKSYTVKRVDSQFVNRIGMDTLKRNHAAWFLPTIIGKDGFGMYIPQGALYNSTTFVVDSLPERVTPYAPVWSAGNGRLALRKGVRITIKCNVPDNLADKAFLAYSYAGGKLGYAGGKYDSGKGEISADVLSLGNFTVATDVTPPQIAPGISNNAVVRGSSVVFRIRDELSGIKDYRVEIDGHWVLAEHDAKTRRVIVPLEHAKISKGKKHTLVMRVWDNCGNENSVKRVFTW